MAFLWFWCVGPHQVALQARPSCWLPQRQVPAPRQKYTSEATVQLARHRASFRKLKDAIVLAVVSTEG
eukprot:2897522-Lingulodinium_polyedra.AAC.1